MTDAARTPPHNLEAERAVLGAVLLIPASLDDLAALEIDEFFLPNHREILDAMRALAKRQRPPDLVMVADELKARQMLERLEGGEGYLLGLLHHACLREMLPHYVSIIAGHALSRRLLARCAETMSSIYGGAPADELLAEHRRGVGELEVHGAGGPMRVGDDLDRVLDEMEKRGQAPDQYMVPTGLVRVDNKIGGLRAEKLIVVAANPGGGKTALAFNILTNAAMRHKIPSLLFSLEMSRAEMIEREIARQARIDGRAVSLGRMTMDEWKRIYAGGVAATIHDMPLWVDDRTLTLGQICAEARRWRARHPDSRAIIAVDYIGLVQPDGDERTREREVAKISGALKALSKKAQCNCPVIAISQLNRDNIGKDAKRRAPVLRDLRESGAIEQDADMVIFPWWETEPPKKGRHPASLIIGKNRGGPKGTIPVIWEPQFTSFSDRTDDDENGDDAQLPLSPEDFDS